MDSLDEAGNVDFGGGVDNNGVGFDEGVCGNVGCVTDVGANLDNDEVGLDEVVCGSVCRVADAGATDDRGIDDDNGGITTWDPLCEERLFSVVSGTVGGISVWRSWLICLLKM